VGSSRALKWAHEKCHAGLVCCGTMGSWGAQYSGVGFKVRGRFGEFAASGLRGIGDFTMVKLRQNTSRETVGKQ